MNCARRARIVFFWFGRFPQFFGSERRRDPSDRRASGANEDDDDDDERRAPLALGS